VWHTRGVTAARVKILGGGGSKMGRSGDLMGFLLRQIFVVGYPLKGFTPPSTIWPVRDPAAEWINTI